VIGIGCFGRYKDATEWLGRGESDSHASAKPHSVDLTRRRSTSE
jgi:hypothetical protein